MAVNPYASALSPGVRIIEDTYGKIPSPLADHSTLYVLGFSTQVGAPVAQLSFIQDSADFSNQFGASLSKPAIDLFFAQYPQSGFYFINVRSRATRSVTATLGAVGAVYSITVDGFTMSYTGIAGDTATTVADNLGAVVNGIGRHLATYAAGNLRLVNSASTVSSSSNIALGSLSAAPAYPVAQDVIDTATDVLLPELKQGFVAAPEFYKSFTTQSDRTLIANSLDGLVSQDTFKWVNLVDAGLNVATQTTGSGAVNLAVAERATFSSPNGHSAYYFPYLLDSLGVSVPPSLVVAAIAIKKYRSDFSQAPAGTKTPILGTTGVTFRVSTAVQDQLNILGINCIRVFDQASATSRRGTVIYAARTLSTSPFWKFINTRVIANVLEGTLRNSFDDEIFETLDGEGEAFNRLTQTGVSICERLRTAGAFYGNSAQDAYDVVCSEVNNAKVDIDNGRVNLDIYFKPSPLLENLFIRCHRTALDTNFTEAQATGNAGTSTAGKPATKPTPDNTNSLAGGTNT